MTVTSMFAQLLILIQEKIASDIPEIKWCDQDFGQLENYEERPAVAWPCTLVDFLTTTYGQLSNDVQEANFSLQLRLGFNPYSSTSGATPIPYREKALEYYEIEEKIFTTFQGWTAGGLIQPMTRVSGQTEPREDIYRVRVINFTSWFEDATAVPATTSVARPPISFEFEQE